MPKQRSRVFINDCFSITLDRCLRDHKQGEKLLIVERSEGRHPIIEIVFGTFSHPDFAQATHLEIDLRRLDDAAPSRQTIELITTIPNFGGFRKWFQCPTCGNRAPRLFLPPTAGEFACKRCHRLRYRSQERRQIKGNQTQIKRSNPQPLMDDRIH